MKLWQIALVIVGAAAFIVVAYVGWLLYIIKKVVM